MECDACSLVKVYLCCGGTCCLHILQYAHCKLPRKVGSLLRCCTVLHLKRYCLHIHCRESLPPPTTECKQYLTVLRFS
jgi:hypothetical protein